MIDTWSEEYRHQCEVRYVLQLRMQGRQKMLDYLDAVKKERGVKPSEKLTNDAREQWNKGNRANEKDWR